MQHNKFLQAHNEIMALADDAYQTGAEHALTVLVETADKYGTITAVETARRWLREGIGNVLGRGSTSGESGTTAGRSAGRDTD